MQEADELRRYRKDGNVGKCATDGEGTIPFASLLHRRALRLCEIMEQLTEAGKFNANCPQPGQGWPVLRKRARAPHFAPYIGSRTFREAQHDYLACPSKNVSAWLIESNFMSLPPKDPHDDDDENEQGEENDDEEDDEPAVIREPDE